MKSRCLILYIFCIAYHSCSHAMFTKLFGFSDTTVEDLLNKQEEDTKELYEDFIKNVQKNNKILVLKTYKNNALTEKDLFEQSKKLASTEQKLKKEKETKAKEQQEKQEKEDQKEQEQREKKCKEIKEQKKVVLMEEALILVEKYTAPKKTYSEVVSQRQKNEITPEIKTQKSAEVWALMLKMYNALRINKLEFKDFVDIMNTSGLSHYNIIAKELKKRSNKLRSLSKKELRNMRTLVKRGEISGNDEMRTIHFYHYVMMQDEMIEGLVRSCDAAKACGRSYVPKTLKKGWFF